MRVIYAPFYAAGLILRYGVYYVIVAPLEVLGRTLDYGVKGGVEPNPNGGSTEEGDVDVEERSRAGFSAALCAALLAAVAPARAEDDEALGFERTPPRLSFSDGEVSFLRPGADGLDAGAREHGARRGRRALHRHRARISSSRSGPRAFVRAGENTQLALASLEPDFLQLRVTAGHVSLDLRSLKAGQTHRARHPECGLQHRAQRLLPHRGRRRDHQLHQPPRRTRHRHARRGRFRGDRGQRAGGGERRRTRRRSSPTPRPSSTPGTAGTTRAPTISSTR